MSLSIKSISAAIAPHTAKLATLMGAYTKVTGEKAQRKAAIAAQDDAVSELRIVLGEVRARDAVGEAQPGELDAARSALAAAERIAAKLHLAAGDVAELEAAEAALKAKIVPIETTLTDLREQHAAAVMHEKQRVLMERAPKLIASYAVAAETTMKHMAELMALHDFVTRELRLPLDILPNDGSHTRASLPTYKGQAFGSSSFGDVKAAALNALRAEWAGPTAITGLSPMDLAQGRVRA